MKKLLIVFLGICGLIFLGVGLVNAADEGTTSLELTADEQVWLAQHPVIRVAYDPNLPPLEFLDVNGQYVGISVDYVKLLEKRLGIEIRPVKAPNWSAIIEMAKHREIDLLPLLTASPERETFLTFTKPYFITDNVIFTRDDYPYVSGLADFLDKRLAVVKGYYSTEVLRNKYPKLDLVEVNSAIEGIKAVSLKKADGFVNDVIGTSYLIRKNGITNIRIAAPLGISNPGYSVGVRKDWPEFVVIVQKALNSITATEHLEISQKWVRVEYTKGINYSLIYQISGFFLFLLIIVLLANRNIRHHQKLLLAAKKDAETAREAADVANRAKSEFLANMSHEIRTPMNAVLGFTEILRSRERDPQKNHYLDSINSAGHALLTLINDVLDLSKIEAGKLELSYSAVSIHHLEDEIEAIFSQKAREKNLGFRVVVSDQVPAVLIMDELRIRQILINLLGNAFKFTEKGDVELSMDAVPSESGSLSRYEVSIIARDTGIGIPPEKINTIFEAFEQAQKSKEKKGGTGLGLAICKRLVEKMGGEISVESEVGKGSIFSIIFKEVEVAAIEGEKKSVKPEVVFDLITFQKAKIIVTDDIDYNREMLKIYLEQYDFEVIEAENGKVLLDKVKDQKPDLIILDMKMPEMDGYEASKILKGDSETSSIPIIAVTASALKQDEEIISELCDGYLRKPVSRKDLISELIRFLPYTTLEKPVEERKDKLSEAISPEILSKKVAALPEEWRKKALNEISKGRMDSIIPLLDEIKDDFPEVFAAAQLHLQNYRFDLLMELLQKEKK